MDAAIAIDYRRLLVKYMRVIQHVEGTNFLNECTSNPETSIVIFSEVELNELDSLADRTDTIF